MTDFRKMVPRRTGGHEILFQPDFRMQTGLCRALWTQHPEYGPRLDVIMAKRDWERLRAIELDVQRHVLDTLALEADAYSCIKFEDPTDVTEHTQASVRLKITARTAIFDQDKQPQDAMPPCGTDMDARLVLQADKVWLRERRFGLEVRVTQIKWYPRAPSAAPPPPKRPRLAPLQFLDDPDA